MNGPGAGTCDVADAGIGTTVTVLIKAVVTGAASEPEPTVEIAEARDAAALDTMFENSDARADETLASVAVAAILRSSELRERAIFERTLDAAAVTDVGILVTDVPSAANAPVATDDAAAEIALETSEATDAAIDDTFDGAGVLPAVVTLTSGAPVPIMDDNTEAVVGATDSMVTGAGLGTTSVVLDLSVDCGLLGVTLWLWAKDSEVRTPVPVGEAVTLAFVNNEATTDVRAPASDVGVAADSEVASTIDETIELGIGTTVTLSMTTLVVVTLLEAVAGGAGTIVSGPLTAAVEDVSGRGTKTPGTGVADTICVVAAAGSLLSITVDSPTIMPVAEALEPLVIWVEVTATGLVGSTMLAGRDLVEPTTTPGLTLLAAAILNGTGLAGGTPVDPTTVASEATEAKTDELVAKTTLGKRPPVDPATVLPGAGSEVVGLVARTILDGITPVEPTEPAAVKELVGCTTMFGTLPEEAAVDRVDVERAAVRAVEGAADDCIPPLEPITDPAEFTPGAKIPPVLFEASVDDATLEVGDTTTEGKLPVDATEEAATAEETVKEDATGDVIVLDEAVAEGATNEDSAGEDVAVLERGPVNDKILLVDTVIMEELLEGDASCMAGDGIEDVALGLDNNVDDISLAIRVSVEDPPGDDTSCELGATREVVAAAVVPATVVPFLGLGRATEEVPLVASVTAEELVGDATCALVLASPSTEVLIAVGVGLDVVEEEDSTVEVLVEDVPVVPATELSVVALEASSVTDEAPLAGSIAVEELVDNTSRVLVLGSPSEGATEDAAEEDTATLELDNVVGEIPPVEFATADEFSDNGSTGCVLLLAGLSEVVIVVIVMVIGVELNATDGGATGEDDATGEIVVVVEAELDGVEVGTELGTELLVGGGTSELVDGAGIGGSVPGVIAELAELELELDLELDLDLEL